MNRSLIDNLKDVGTGAALLLNKQNNEPCLILKLPEDINFDASTPIGYGTFELHQYDPEGVIIRTIIEVYKDLQHLSKPLVYLDTFINPNNEADQRLLQAMAKASYLQCFAWHNDANLTYLGGKKLRWQDQHRQSIHRLIKESKGTSTIWPDAKIRCMRENPMY